MTDNQKSVYDEWQRIVCNVKDFGIVYSALSLSEKAENQSSAYKHYYNNSALIFGNKAESEYPSLPVTEESNINEFAICLLCAKDVRLKKTVPIHHLSDTFDVYKTILYDADNAYKRKTDSERKKEREEQLRLEEERRREEERLEEERRREEERLEEIERLARIEEERIERERIRQEERERIREEEREKLRIEERERLKREQQERETRKRSSRASVSTQTSSLPHKSKSSKRRRDYFGLPYLVSLFLAVIPVTSWLLGIIIRFSEGKIIAGILRMLLGLWIWFLDLICILLSKRILRLLSI